ncbi:MAG: radical SAM protein [Candidatus Sumerlaeota bacterium]|nr:radical SAM protein [Candidatus Sumerlaeota bacterium]
MGPWMYRAKEGLEQRLGLRFARKSSFPFVRAQRRFLTVRLDLHNKCNLRCRMCYFSLDTVWNAPAAEMSDFVLERLEREVWPRTRELWLSCAAEPLTARKLDRAIRGAKRRKVPLAQLVTNLVALTENKARLLIDAGLDRLWGSLDAVDADTYEGIRPGAGLERVVENLRRFQAIKRELGVDTPALGILMVMMVENLAEWPGVVRLAADLGAGQIVFNPQTYYTELEQEDRLWNHRREVNEALERSRQAARECGILLSAPEPFRETDSVGARADSAAAPRAFAACRSPFEHLTIDPWGKVTPCAPLFMDTSFGNLEQRSFHQIYYGEAFRRLREAMRTGAYWEACRNCPATPTRDLNDLTAFKARDLSQEEQGPEPRAP